MANMIVREELKSRGVRHWELAHALGVSEQTLVRWLRFELSEDKQMDMLEKRDYVEELVAEEKRRREQEEQKRLQKVKKKKGSR